MARLAIRPLALVTGALSTLAILCAILLLTAGTSTATSNLRMLTVDTTTIGSQVLAFFQEHLKPSGVAPENIRVVFVPGAQRSIYYRGDVAGTLTGNTSLTTEILDATIKPARYEGDIWGTEWSVIEVRNGTNGTHGTSSDSALLTSDDAIFNETSRLWHEMIHETLQWNRTTSATINPQPAAGLLIAGTVLHTLLIPIVVLMGVGMLHLDKERYGPTRFGPASLAVLAAIFNLASAAYITNILRNYGTGYTIDGTSGGRIVANVPYMASAPFYALTWINTVCALLVAGAMLGLMLMEKRQVGKNNAMQEKNVHEEED